jgi:hypothetical protein
VDERNLHVLRIRVVSLRRNAACKHALPLSRWLPSAACRIHANQRGALRRPKSENAPREVKPHATVVGHVVHIAGENNEEGVRDVEQPGIPYASFSMGALFCPRRERTRECRPGSLI